jgi:hypothetical protein
MFWTIPEYCCQLSAGFSGQSGGKMRKIPAHYQFDFFQGLRLQKKWYTHPVCFYVREKSIKYL